MWAISNETAYAAERTWVRDKHGHHHWIVVVKATFEFGPHGKLRLADEQLPPLHEPEYFGAPGQSSVRYEADLIARKPTTDVIVNAHAHAPGGRPTQEVLVQLRALGWGGLRKYAGALSRAAGADRGVGGARRARLPAWAGDWLRVCGCRLRRAQSIAKHEQVVINHEGGRSAPEPGKAGAAPDPIAQMDHHGIRPDIGLLAA